MKTPFQLTSFRKSQTGNVSIMFAAALLPVLGTIGFAVDFSRASEVKSQLAAAVDSTALTLAHGSANLTDEQLQAKANVLIQGNFRPGTPATTNSVHAEREPATLTVNASAAFETAFLKVLNVATLDVSAKSKVVWGSKQKIEVVMALDNTGSMAGTKIEELRKAATDLVDTLEASQGAIGSVKVGLVPFAAAVRVDPAAYKSANWIRFDDVEYQEQECSWKRNRQGDRYRDCDTETRIRDFNKSNWQGCIVDRDQPYDVDDTTFDTRKPQTLYPAVETCPSQQRDLQVVQPLTSDFNKLRTAIKAMKPAGSTNVTIGIAWGMSLLSNKQPFDQGSPVTTGEGAVKKYLIILTDGENTENRFGDNNRGAVDARTRLACKAAREMGTVFSIRMIEGDQALLKACASDPKNYHDVEAAADLGSVFRAIGNQIGKLRVAE